MGDARPDLASERERCDYEDQSGRCTGIRLGNDGNCFAHTTPDQRGLALAMFHAGADLNFARGIPFSKELLKEILEHAPVEDGRRVLTNVTFDGATFSGDASFGGATFSGDARFNEATFSDDAGFGGATFSGSARFDGATFSGDARFDGATFSGDARFNEATFSDHAWFSAATFYGDAWFGEATFSGPAGFDGATFSGVAGFGEATFSHVAGFHGATFSRVAWFDAATFSEDAWFDGATFSDDARFDAATFSGVAWFGQATFSGPAGFDGATFSDDARFDAATFSEDAGFRTAEFTSLRQFGPLLILGVLIFDGAVFSADSDIEVVAKRISCQKTRFRDEVNFRVRWADVILEDADFGAAGLVDRAPAAFQDLDESKLADGRDREGQPRVVSVRRANVANLVLADVDLRPCRFSGAHKLDGLRMESTRQLEKRPQGWRRQLGLPPVWKWTVRRAIAEEHEWRWKNERGIKQRGWYPDACQPPPPEEVTPLSPRDIQNIYRDLRKGREDMKDEPGAADFYYGEMEMRRAATPPSFEKFLLWLYWLVSGYGLRASRALAALAVTVLVCSVALHLWGLPAEEAHSLNEIIVFGMQSTTSLLRAPDIILTLPGQVIHMALRLLGPLFFGLALLSLRGRVKR